MFVKLYSAVLYAQSGLYISFKGITMTSDISEAKKRNFEDLRGIKVDDREFWKTKIEEMQKLSEKAGELYSELIQKKSKNTALINEVRLFGQMVGTAQVAWDMTETEPGQAAGFTLEEIPIEERLSVRRTILDVLTTGPDTIFRAQSELATLG